MPSKVSSPVATRLLHEDRQAFYDTAEQLGRHPSEILRELVLAWLANHPAAELPQAS
jgi:hypothetical protein